MNIFAGINVDTCVLQKVGKGECSLPVGRDPLVTSRKRWRNQNGGRFEFESAFSNWKRARLKKELQIWHTKNVYFLTMWPKKFAFWRFTCPLNNDWHILSYQQLSWNPLISNLEKKSSIVWFNVLEFASVKAQTFQSVKMTSAISPIGTLLGRGRDILNYVVSPLGCVRWAIFRNKKQWLF